MNNYYFNDNTFRQTQIYKDFIGEYPASGNLRIRAYTANGAIPVSNLNVIIYKEYENSKIIFYEGSTDESGLIENIILPAPELSSNIMTTPNFATYVLNVSGTKDNINKIYRINIYENVYVVQNINVTPSPSLRLGDNYGN